MGSTPIFYLRKSQRPYIKPLHKLKNILNSCLGEDLIYYDGRDINRLLIHVPNYIIVCHAFNGVNIERSSIDKVDKFSFLRKDKRLYIK